LRRAEAKKVRRKEGREKRWKRRSWGRCEVEMQWKMIRVKA